ncbi:MAG: cupin domain-containing protein [Phycisphaerales bacterium]
MTDARHIRWTDLPADRPMPLIERQRIIAEAMMVSRVHLAKGFHLDTHQHTNEQWVVMLSGRCRFGLGAEGTAARHEVEVSGGEVLVLPSGVPHSCDAIEDTVILDLFSPPSEKTGVDRA